MVALLWMITLQLRMLGWNDGWMIAGEMNWSDENDGNEWMVGE